MLLKDYFSSSRICQYDFKLKNLIYLKKKKNNGEKWKIYQTIFLIWFIWSRFTNYLTKSAIWNFEKNFMLTISNIFRKIGLMEGKVLDIGGGCGSFRGYWTNQQNSIYINHDPNIHAFENIFLNEKTKDVFLVEGVAEDLPYRDNIFDIVIMSDALDHFNNPQKALKEAFRVLKSNAKIIILHCYRKKSFLNFVKEFINQKMHQNPLDKKMITKLIKEAGFKKSLFYVFPVSHSSINIFTFKAIKKKTKT